MPSLSTTTPRVSDLQLRDELERIGRPVTTAILKDWHKMGLLPVLAARGLRRAGRSIFWNGPDVVDRARYVYDAVQACRDPKLALWLLWVAGFDLPIPDLKRAWLYRQRRKLGWTVRQTDTDVLRRALKQRPPASLRRPTALGAIALIAAPLDLKDSLISWRLFIEALDRMGRTLQLTREIFGEWTNARYGVIAASIITTAESANLVATASAAELLIARSAAVAASRLLGDGGGKVTTEGTPPHFTPLDAANIGTPFVLGALLLIRGGRQEQLDRSIRSLEQLSRNGGPGNVVALRQCQKRLSVIWRELGRFELASDSSGGTRSDAE